jgi:predicted AAA+ superfamily ATPase
MPHLRARHALSLLQKKLQYSPVVSIQGVRQCGKSTLARELLPSTVKGSVYRTLDLPSVLDSAIARPESFLEALSDSGIVILDEAQKAPKLFDAIKALVDQNRRPGQYLLLGSTEFSKAMKIREALTGRLSRLRLFPMTLGETLGLKQEKSRTFFLSTRPRVNRRALLQFLHRGGMPGIFATRSESERQGQFEDWLSLTVERDALQIPTRRLNPVLLRRVLREIVLAREPDAVHLSRALRISPTSIRTMLDALKTLFVIHEIPPHPAGTGKPHYYLCDPGLATQLGASFEKQLKTWFYLEVLSRLASHGLDGNVLLSYYRTSKGSLIHGVWEEPGKTTLLKLLDREGIDERELLVLESAKLKHFPKADLISLGGIRQSEKVRSVHIHPWESLA